MVVTLVLTSKHFHYEVMISFKFVKQGKELRKETRRDTHKIIKKLLFQLYYIELNLG